MKEENRLVLVNLLTKTILEDIPKGNWHNVVDSAKALISISEQRMAD